MDKYNEYIKEQFNIDDKVLALVVEAENALAERFAGIDDITAICQMKVLKAFQENHIKLVLNYLLMKVKWNNYYVLKKYQKLLLKG